MRLVLKYLRIYTIIIIILSSLVSINITSKGENLPYKEEIFIPIDTSKAEARFQPIDVHVEFKNPCWAKNEILHSVRIYCEEEDEKNEIESQIYDLEFNDETYIKSCNIVFLIPESTSGNEKYFVYYGASETEETDYEDHIQLEDTHYFYEPISGQKIDFDYYKITEDEDIIYAVIQKGELLGNPISQHVGKFKPGSKVVETYNIDQLAAFDLRYGISEQPSYYGSSWANNVKKTILVDGNLMSRVRIECYSPDEKIKSDNIYTYYYSPGETKSIFVNAHHEVLETIDIEDPEFYDGSISGIISIKSRSATIEKMNVGEILPKIFLYSEKETIEEYSVPSNPQSEKKEAVLSTNDDIDLGEKAWMCLSDPETGKTHGLILESNTGSIEGYDSGIQVKAWVKQNVKLPGLEADTGNVFMLRNTYEKNSEHQTVLEKDLKSDYNIRFLTVEKQGYEIINRESEIFQKIVKNIPSKGDSIELKEDKVERYSLKTYVHLAPSIPLGPLLSAVLGKNIPYIYAELYKDNVLKSSGSVSRLPLASMELDLEGMNIFQKIKTLIRLFDWGNASLFKKIIFPDLVNGTYVVKIFKENSLFNKQRQYIGFGIINVNKDTTTHIFCKPEGKIIFNVFNQNKKDVENVRFLLQLRDVTIADATSDKNGNVVIKAPCDQLEPYTLKILYQGFLVKEKDIKLGWLNNLFELKDSLKINLNNFELKIKDTWGFPPAIDLKPTLTSKNMIEPVHIQGTEIKTGEYLFYNVYPSEYSLDVSYKSFDINEQVNIDVDKKLDVKFPAEYKLCFNVMNSYGSDINNGRISISREYKKIAFQINEKESPEISVPPGDYRITVFSNDEEIAKQDIQIRSDKEISIVTKEESLIHVIVSYLGIIFLILSIMFTLWKKNYYIGIRLVLISIILIALFSPWWVLDGSNAGTVTSTKTFLIPSNFVTFTSARDVFGGEVSQVPTEVTMVLTLIRIILILVILVIVSTFLTYKKFKRISCVLSCASFVMIIGTIGIFYYTMFQLTEIGVGSFIGNGDIEVALPGIAESEVINCSWGPGVGFYLMLIIVVIFIAVLIGGFAKKKIIIN